jgi:RNA polymerase sigma-70 factor (ECF subfamily)
MDDQAAVTRIRQGDPNGLETLVARYQVKAVQAAYLILHDRSLAEEVAQAGFVRVVEKIDQFQDGRPFTAWFFKIVINDAIKLARQQKRLTGLEEEPDPEAHRLAGWLIDPQPLPEKALEIEQSKETIRAAMRQLTPEQRAAVVMRYYLDMSEADIASRLDRRTSMVKWLLRSARQKLGQLLRTVQDPEGQK